MNKIDDIIAYSGKIAFKVITKTVAIILGGGIFSLILWVMLLPLFSHCGLGGQAALQCVVLFCGIIFLAIVCPILFFLFGRSYALEKVLNEFYQKYKHPILFTCSQQACQHRELIMSTQKFKQSKVLKELPFFVRLILSKIDLSFLTTVFSKNPQITPQELEATLERVIKDKALIPTPKLHFFWILVLLMLLVFFGLKYFVH